uniref:Uncharacterized protein n=1 Tax=Nomascus leucogenys TaxID=61853 RepID=A0A2I3H4D7_NOMLE
MFYHLAETWSHSVAQAEQSQKEELGPAGLWGSSLPPEKLLLPADPLKRRPLWAPAPKTDKPGRMLLSSMSHVSWRKPVYLNDQRKL